MMILILHLSWVIISHIRILHGRIFLPSATALSPCAEAFRIILFVRQRPLVWCWCLLFLFELCIQFSQRNNQSLDFSPNSRNITHSKIKGSTFCDQPIELFAHSRVRKCLIAHDVRVVCVSTDKYSTITTVFLTWN